MAYDPCDLDALYGSLGEALSAWSSVEIAITDLFCTISDMPETKALALFESVVDFRLRLQMCGWMMALEETDPIEAEMWNWVSVKAGKLYRKRHELAHFALKQMGDGRVSIVPFLKLSQLGEQKELTTPQIADRTQSFIKISVVMSWFHWRAVARRQEFPASQPVAEPPEVAHVRELVLRKRQ